MPKKGARVAHKASKKWLVRIGLAGVAAFLGAISVSSSLATSLRKADPQRAAVLAPRDGVILASAAEAQFLERFEAGHASAPARLARQALAHDPTAVKALSVLGFQAFLRGENVASDRIFAYSTRLSRRELRPMIWAIEKAVERGDIRSALTSYDLALRTSHDAQEALFPTLAAALSQPKIRRELLAVLSEKPQWTKDFIVFAAISGTDPDSAMSFFREGSSTGLPVDNDNRAGLVNVFALKGDFAKAWEYYASYRSEADRRRSRDPEFRLQTDARAVFDWSLGDDIKLSASILAAKSGGRVDFSAPPSAGGVIVKQMQALAAGTYRLEGLSTGIDQPESTAPYWSLQCHDGAELGRVPVPGNGEATARFSGVFTVPQGCPVQTLAFIVRPADDIVGVSGQIVRAQLNPQAAP